ncbi:LysR family transcriptional regulator [Paucibacter sp. DJ2R-2]|uniref:LysR family transcriptional regulator n=1 Tax=Paucibacter sp. DJ2R-2 TaxID=2893558 RepID=UPI0021E417ED|nr:LysR family transcriptional regulator [Paucibacter sp. DJ2R-2]MCV2418974.1 LysR family transcriptional regulator [Paucibacter sp. DJ4R-1]MCV2438071.1 LysR family transcriptional regulator [Paucibacter sp. DJ2R-2]
MSIAPTQFTLSAADLKLMLALLRGGTLAAAGERLGVDASTVFRSLQKLERGLGQRLFERSRSGYQANDLALQLAAHAEQIEAQLEAAQNAARLQPEQLGGTVRISSTDTLLHGLLAPALKPLQARHPRLGFELHTGNELASLSRRDADIALRATRRPPEHLIGRHLGPLRVALFVAAGSPLSSLEDALAAECPWVAPDEALPEHPSVLWRKRHWPKITPQYQVGSILSVQELVALGLGVGVLPLFLAQQRAGLRQLGRPIDEAQSELWLLSHPESRHLRRVAEVFSHLASTISLA